MGWLWRVGVLYPSLLSLAGDLKVLEMTSMTVYIASTDPPLFDIQDKH